MRVIKVILWTLLGWFLGGLVIGVGFSLLMAAAGADNPQAETTVGGLGGLLGIVLGMTYGIRRTKRPEKTALHG